MVQLRIDGREKDESWSRKQSPSSSSVAGLQQKDQYWGLICSPRRAVALGRRDPHTSSLPTAGRRGILYSPHPNLDGTLAVIGFLPRASTVFPTLPRNPAEQCSQTLIV